MTHIEKNGRVTDLFKVNNKIFTYVAKNGEKWLCCLGKPTDGACLSWTYDTREKAQSQALGMAQEYENDLQYLFTKA